MQIFVNLITRAIFMSTPLVLGALGEVLAERTGMMVTAIEGIFLVGAWGGFIGAYLSGNLLIGFLLAMVCGLIVSLLYGVTTIYMHQHQIVMGTAVAILVTGCCSIFRCLCLRHVIDFFHNTTRTAFFVDGYCLKNRQSRIDIDWFPIHF